MNTYKTTIISIALLILMFVNSCATVTVGYDEDSLHQIADRGNEVVSAIENFKITNGYYPEDIKELIPEYLPEIPKTGIKTTKFVLPMPIPDSRSEEEFRYLKFKEQDPSKDPVQNGYRLLVIIDPMTFMDDENIWKCLLYRSSGKYPKLRLEEPKERIGEWSVVVRASGSAYKSEEDIYDHFLNY